MLGTRIKGVASRGFFKKVLKGVAEKDEEDNRLLNIDNNKKRGMLAKMMNPQLMDNKFFIGLLGFGAAVALMARNSGLPMSDISIKTMESEATPQSEPAHGVFNLKTPSKP